MLKTVLILAVLCSSALAENPSGGIDTHIHLYEPAGLDWLKPDNTRLNQPHHAERFKAVSAGTPITWAVAVEAGTSLEHNEWMLEHAADKPVVAAVIGNLDLADPETGDILERFAQNPKFRGLRNRARGKVDFSDETVRKNIRWLEGRKMVLETGLDLHTRTDIVSIAQRYPDLTIIINHMAGGRLDTEKQPQGWWGPLVEELGECPNVYCKLSMFDAVFQHNYSPDRLDALFNPIMDAFGPDRLLFGSNWPISPDYEGMYNLFAQQLSSNTALMTRILVENPQKAYRLDLAGE
ncbi:amidohydrolase family protein [Pontiella desulfatans]|nr:amidohydrolase family protein [Pontiella desulfatans]